MSSQQSAWYNTWDSEETTLGTNGGKQLGSLEGFTDVTADSKFEGLLLGSRLGLVNGIKLGTDKVTEIGLWDGELLGTRLGSITTWCI